MPKHSHSRAAAHANLRLALKLTGAHNAALTAFKHERLLLDIKLGDPRDELAHRRWLRACSVLAAKLDRLDDAMKAFELSARLAKEQVS